MENPSWFFWISKENYFLEHLSEAVSNLFLFATLLSCMLFTSVVLQIKLYRSDVAWVLARIWNFIFYLRNINFESFWKLILKNQKVPQMD